MGLNINELPADLARKLGIKKRKPRDIERREQVALIEWARVEERRHPALALLYAIPNGGHRHPAVAAKLRAEGVRAGVLDLCLPAARRGYHGLYLEMKSADGKLTDLQKAFRAGVMTENYYVAVCYSATEAIQALRWYLELAEDCQARATSNTKRKGTDNANETDHDHDGRRGRQRR
jgi:hypothetical protein